MKETENTPHQGHQDFLGWRMVAMGFLCQNLVLGATYGTYSLLINPLTETFSTPRSLSSSGIALITLMMGVAAPWIGKAMDRFSIRSIITIGALLTGLGLLGAAQARNLTLFLLAYTLLVGMGAAMMGPLAAATLANNWFQKKRGLAMGIVSIPLLPALMPLMFSQGLEVFGWRHSLMGTALLFFLVLPLLTMIVSRPSDVGQRPYGSAKVDHSSPCALTQDCHRWTTLMLLKNLKFFSCTVFAGLITAGSIVIVTHIVPYATDYGISAGNASLLLACNGVFSMVGALSIGWISDRFGAGKALGISALIQAVLWCVLLTQPPFPLLLLAVMGIGFSAGGCVPAFNNLLAHTFGAPSFGTVLGLASVVLLPMNFGAPVFAGVMFDMFGSYEWALRIHIAMFFAAAIFFVFVCHRISLRSPTKSTVGFAL
ncbi:MFS transporter [Pseudomaricurvus alkylphenolicus]|jgi:MFS family permease|uniref:MFS transporter n=1 Tax=Pseudomaricurvus alkylphenolicus TaxID=1306991 RepID=UPI00141EBB72|nr:MFS transporter [Pseudomaricurvus alkylphenolicus]NIB38986.1 MFS transporter [Pseudomaricurvus alkylphenolicus]